MWELRRDSRLKQLTERQRRGDYPRPPLSVVGWVSAEWTAGHGACGRRSGSVIPGGWAYWVVLFALLGTLFSDPGRLWSQSFDRASSSQSVSEDLYPLKQQLRLSWGGGSERTWQVHFKIDSGQLGDFQLLGLAPDTPGSAEIAEGEFRLRQPTPGTYGGVDIEVAGQADSRVLLEIFPAENPEQRVVRTIPLQTLRQEGVTGPLDNEQNQFSVVRAPGDFLELDIGRPHLVFEPGETWSLKLRPRSLPLESRSIRCTARMLPTRGNGAALLSRSWEMVLDDQGNGTASDWQLKVPADEGVYDLVFELDTQRYQQASFGANRIQRRIQFVVLGREPPSNSSNSTRFRLIGTAEAAAATKWDRRLNLANRSSLPAYLRNGNPSVNQSIDVGDLRMLRLKPGEWQTLPLPTKDRGIPHRIEIDYRNAGELAIGFSLIEADATGNVSMFGSDSGVARSSSETLSETEQQAAVLTHHLECWPQTGQPLLLVVNRHPTAEMAIGQIRVFAGPNRLESNGLSTPEGRGRMAYYEYPLFAENFSASLAFDAPSDQWLTDWVTFYEGTDRLIQHLQAHRYRGAFVTVVADGSALYPSGLLGATPRFDNGTFFSSGQDPYRKNVLEMMLRMFSRAGLQLVPVVNLNGRLPNLEKAAATGTAPDVLLADQHGQLPPPGSSLPRYNALNLLVQQEVQRIVFELVDAFGNHPAFGGVALTCQADSCIQLPGRRWGFDREQANRFLQEKSLPQAAPSEDFYSATVPDVLLGTARDGWLEFRSRALTRWYRDLERTLRSGGQPAPLYLMGVDLYRIGDLPSLLSPSLQWPLDLHAALLELGWNLDQLSQLEHTVVLRPNRLAPLASLADERNEINLANLPTAQQLYSQGSHSADLYVRRAGWARIIESTSESTPPELPAVIRWQPVRRAGRAELQPFADSLARFDSRLFVDGGWLLPPVSESDEFFETLARLADKPFATVTPSAGKSPLAVRQLSTARGWQAYLVNASPWPVTAQLELALPGAELNVFPANLARPLDPPVTDSEPWPTVVPPYGLIVLESPEQNQWIRDYQISIAETEVEALRGRLRRIQEQLVSASTPRPWPVLQNAEFDPRAESTLGWRFDPRYQKQVSIDRDPVQDTNWALHLQSAGPTVWVRSHELPMPKTGRLSISVWLRIDEEASQPPLRIAIEADTQDLEYYRFAKVGSLAQNSSSDLIDSRWKQFVVHFDDLPLQSAETVRVGFDMMGPGGVWIDRVELNDRWFDAHDTKALTQLLAAAGPLLREPASWNECRRLLEGYWMRFLDQIAEPDGKVPQGESLFPANSGEADSAANAPTELNPPTSETGFNPFSLRRNRRADKPRMLPFR